MVLIMEYDGTHYYGFQLQANLPTIQGEIETALWKLTGERSRVMAASRTDSGVHAKRQVASFRTKSSLPSPTFIKGLNYYLPSDIYTSQGKIFRENGELQIPPETYFVMGDNRERSFDSREWGPVPKENIVGKVWIRYWPLSKIGVIKNGVKQLVSRTLFTGKYQ